MAATANRRETKNVHRAKRVVFMRAMLRLE
jgi:hypothetical protein